MTKALILAGCPHATVTLYRCIHLQEQLARLGIVSTVQPWQEQPLPAEANSCDLLVLQRVAMTAPLRRLIDQLHADGKTVIFDTDDLVFEPTMVEWHRGVARLTAEEQEQYRDGVQRTLATLEASDVVLTASPFLAELARRRGKAAYVHRNAVGSEMQALVDRLYARQRQRDAIVIGYGSGTPTHDVDFAEAVPALLDVMAQHRTVQLWLVGPLELPDALAVFGDRIRRHPLMDWRSYLELASQFDIALAPLEQGNLFCRAKSEIKFVEAGLLGVPVVASRIDPYVDVIVHGQNGLLAGNMAAWMEALEMLVSQPGLRVQLGQAARQTVAEHYSLEARTADLAHLLARIEMDAPHAMRQPRSQRLDLQAGNSGETASTGEVERPANAPAASKPGMHSLEQPAPVEPFVPLVLNWIVTEPFRGAGGHLGVFRMVQQLVGFGHECHVYVVPVEQMHDWPAERIARFVDQNFMPTGATFHRWHGRVYDADATFATYWSTAYNLRDLPNGGKRYYLVQDFEPYFYPVGSDYLRAENTYRMGFHCITLGPWLAKLMRTQYGAQADHFDFAVDTEIYWPQPQPRAAHPRVAFYARPSTPRRAYEIGIEALQQVKERCPEAEIILYGSAQLDPPPFSYVHLGVRSQYELATLYSTCDVGLVLSLTNPSFVPFEMMACKCALVDIRSERVEGLLAHGQNALLAEPTPEGIADAVLTLLWDKELRTKIIEQAYAQVKSMSWRSSARQIERVLLEHAPPPAQRLAQRRPAHTDAGALLWQIHQVLDQRAEDAAETDQLRRALQRVLVEKASLAEEVRQLQQSATQAPAVEQNRADWAQRWRAQAARYVPAWRGEKALFSKLPITSTPLRQQFQAQENLLCGVEVLFAPYTGAGRGTVRMTLYEEGKENQPLATAIMAADETAPGQPYRLACPPQIFSKGRSYLFTLATESSPGFPHGVWRAWRRSSPAQRLQLGQRTLAGQLLFRPLYAALDPAQAAEAPPADMTTPRAVVVETAAEIQRLARKTGHVVRSRGVRGLLNEAILYIRWRLFYK